MMHCETWWISGFFVVAASFFSVVSPWPAFRQSHQNGDKSHPSWGKTPEERYREAYEHDLKWNDAVDGSYDLPLVQNSGDAHAQHSRLVHTKFRRLPETPETTRHELLTTGHGVSIKGPRLTKHVPTIHDEVPLYLAYGQKGAAFSNQKLQPEVPELRNDDDNDDEKTGEVEIELGPNVHVSNIAPPSAQHAVKPVSLKGINNYIVNYKNEDKTPQPEKHDPSSGHASAAGFSRLMPEETKTLHVSPLSAPPQRLNSPSSLLVPVPAFDISKMETDKRLVPSTKNGAGDNGIVIPIIIACMGVVVLGGVIAALLYRRVSKDKRQYAEEEPGYGYGRYGITGPIKQTSILDLNGDKLLAKSAEIFHYRQQKPLIVSPPTSSFGSGSRGSGSSRGTGSSRGSQDRGRVDLHSDYDTEDEDEEGDEFGDYTVYECPGLAPPGEFEVVNPLFADHKEKVIEIIYDN